MVKKIDDNIDVSWLIFFISISNLWSLNGNFIEWVHSIYLQTLIIKYIARHDGGYKNNYTTFLIHWHNVQQDFH